MGAWHIDDSLSRQHSCWLGKIEWTRASTREEPDLWRKPLEREAVVLRERFPDKDSLASDPLILAARTAYEAYGVNPRRYPPASEALIRRVALQQQPVPAINQMVDFNNLVSLRTLCPVGSYDRDRIVGDVTFLRGGAGHRYAAIGGSEFIAENFPTFVDNAGPFGGSSRDSVRTMVTQSAANITTVLMAYADPMSHGLDRILRKAIEEAVNAGLRLESHEWIAPAS
jgi:DNA/RNA-binding domain of Phe-tRNA-synthetase-like protein